MFLGIDTSCYTTSFAITDEEGRLVFDERKLLAVPTGEGGLRQADGVFKHLQNIPDIVKRIKNNYKITAIAVSTRPRPAEKSYMPVFMAGLAVAESLSAFNNIPLYYTSHQEGHIQAGLYAQGLELKDPFLAVHISGGTSEILHVYPHSQGFKINLLGGTADLHAGQFIDRIGVLMGLSFPCGKDMEQLAISLSEEPSLRLHGHTKGMFFHLSGAETEAKRMLKNGQSHSEIAFAVFRVIANALEKVLSSAIKETQLKNILFVGGVASNTLIKKRLKLRLEHPAIGAKLFFTDPRYATDNAVGVSLIARKNFLSSRN